MDEAFMLNPIITEHEKINEQDFDASETNESPKDEGEEEVRHKKFRKYFLYVEDDDVDLDFVLPVLHGKPANGKFYVFERRKDAQQIINHLVTLGKQAAILGDSIRYTSKNKVPTK